MVGHQTVGPDINTAPTAPFCHQVDVLPIVIVTTKCLLSAIPTLRYMMRVSGNNDS